MSNDENGWLRAATFGGMDGLTTSIALVIGLAWSGMDIGSVNLSGLSAAIAGAMSMGLGEYVSVQTHNEQPGAYRFNPIIAALSSFLCFIAGSSIPLVPLLFDRLDISIYAGLTALFLSGAWATKYTHRSWFYGGTRQLLFGVLAVGATCALGSAVS